jgi:hypothetical protein
VRQLSASDLLNVWEGGLAASPVERALALLGTASPETAPEELAGLSVGQRDARLLTLREWTFGPRLVCLVNCPECGERLELAFDAADIQAASGEELAGEMSLSVGGHEVRFRLPNSGDMMAMVERQGGGNGRQLVLERCVVAARRKGEDVAVDQLPSEVLEAIVERMAEADPQADVQLALACPDCGHEWGATFDIVAFFWQEINAWARRTLRQVHVLASAYGWREADILALSPERRHIYLEMVGG